MYLDFRPYPWDRMLPQIRPHRDKALLRQVGIPIVHPDRDKIGEASRPHGGIRKVAKSVAHYYKRALHGG